MTPSEPVITVVDHRGYTVIRFRKATLPATSGYQVGAIHVPAQPAGDAPEWLIEPVPQSRKSRQRSTVMLARHGADAPPGHRVRWRRQTLDDGRQVLELPGLTLRWERLLLALDKLDESNTTTLTIDQLRSVVQRFC